jgi:hypothetical protein
MANFVYIRPENTAPLKNAVRISSFNAVNISSRDKGPVIRK